MCGVLEAKGRKCFNQERGSPGFKVAGGSGGMTVAIGFIYFHTCGSLTFPPAMTRSCRQKAQ